MPTLYTPFLNEYLREQLRNHNCRSGKFTTTGDGRAASLTGNRRDGKAIFVWAFAREFSVTLAQYLENCCPPDTARLTIHIDLTADLFRYELISQATVARLGDEEAEQEKQRRRNTPRDQTPYGPALAGQVADALQRGRSLGHSHRDYCGLGLEYQDGQFRYGEIWDGGLDALQTFPDRAAFIGWLAGQSDASLAQIDQPDPWLWDNQTITRARLLEFVRVP